jgi:4-carboxymuconolactone decarboxylase
MPRLSPLDLDALDAEQREVADAIVAGPRGGLRGPFEVWLRSPQLCDRAQKLGEFCRFGSALPPHLSELAILLTGRHWRAQYEFFAHSRLARQAGIPDAVIDAIRLGESPALEDPAQQVVYDAVTEYLATTRLSDATYARAIEALGERGLVDLIGVVGYYGLVSMTLNVFEVGVPEGETPPLPEP